jgi:hypothetical protein
VGGGGAAGENALASPTLQEWWVVLEHSLALAKLAGLGPRVARGGFLTQSAEEREQGQSCVACLNKTLPNHTRSAAACGVGLQTSDPLGLGWSPAAIYSPQLRPSNSHSHKNPTDGVLKREAYISHVTLPAFFFLFRHVLGVSH